MAQRPFAVVFCSLCMPFYDKNISSVEHNRTHFLRSLVQKTNLVLNLMSVLDFCVCACVREIYNLFLLGISTAWSCLSLVHMTLGSVIQQPSVGPSFIPDKFFLLLLYHLV